MQLHKFKIHWGAICLITVLSLVMYGCGGGGSSSSSAMEEEEMMPGDGDGGGMEPAECAEGETGTPPNCMAAGSSQDDIDNEAMLLAAEIGLNKDGTAGLDVTPTDDPAGAGDLLSMGMKNRGHIGGLHD